jgi:hypothetical protein
MFRQAYVVQNASQGKMTSARRKPEKSAGKTAVSVRFIKNRGFQFGSVNRHNATLILCVSRILDYVRRCPRELNIQKV